ncbi:hypothetical protein Tco_0405037 [Tanacetum coccineum]
MKGSYRQKKKRHKHLLKTKNKFFKKKQDLLKPYRLDALEKALEKEEVAKQVYLDSLIAQRMAEEQELTEEQKKRKAPSTQPTEIKIEEDKDDSQPIRLEREKTIAGTDSKQTMNNDEYEDSE